MPKSEGKLKLNSGVSTKWVKRNRSREREKDRRRRKRKKSVKKQPGPTIARFASTEAAWINKVSENNGQLCFRPSPRVAHASRLDQKKMITIVSI